MAFPAPQRSLDLLLVVSWPVLIGIAYYRFRRGEFSRRRLYGFGAFGSLTAGTSLAQLSDTVTAPFDAVLEGTGLFVVVLGVLAAVRWWRLRDVEAEEHDT